MKKIVYFDMDGVLADFIAKVKEFCPDFEELDEEAGKKVIANVKTIPNFFAELDPLEGAVEAFKELSKHYDCYILSTPSWSNTVSWGDKCRWIKEHLGDEAFKRLILTHNKNLNVGDFLIDDRTANGTDEFSGEHIHFGTDEYPNWESVLNYLVTK